jgi:hypothetical protein
MPGLEPGFDSGQRDANAGTSGGSRCSRGTLSLKSGADDGISARAERDNAQPQPREFVVPEDVARSHLKTEELSTGPSEDTRPSREDGNEGRRLEPGAPEFGAGFGIDGYGMAADADDEKIGIEHRHSEPLVVLRRCV